MAICFTLSAFIQLSGNAESTDSLKGLWEGHALRRRLRSRRSTWRRSRNGEAGRLRPEPVVPAVPGLLPLLPSSARCASSCTHASQPTSGLTPTYIRHIIAEQLPGMYSQVCGMHEATLPLSSISAEHGTSMGSGAYTQEARVRGDCHCAQAHLRGELRAEAAAGHGPESCPCWLPRHCAGPAQSHRLDQIPQVHI